VVWSVSAHEEEAVPDTRPTAAETHRVLVKLRPSSALRAAAARIALRPMHDTPDAAFALDAGPQWFLAELPDGAATPWDLAHARVADQLGVDASDVVFAEPDVVHHVFLDTNEPAVEGLAVGANCDRVDQDRGGGKAVGPDRFAWHLEDAFSQLGAARESVAFTDPRTRIAHLDTGYYRAHVTTPEHVLRHLERSFVDDDGDRNSAEDPDNRVLLIDNSGHGTGTIGILAGNRVPDEAGAFLGGAPEAEILPLRIADRVVLLRTSAFARALRYALEQRCDVATMSMGGLPSQAWAEAVNEAYLGGLCLVAAAGNNANGLPTRNLVYPARYRRVIAACGVMGNHKAYAGLTGLTTLEGNYGPASRMGAAIAAYTPNIPWPVFGCADAIRRNGEGTSSATPQVAAAVALWFEKYKGELPRDWRRVEAVRHALFTTARDGGDRKRLGHGIVQASRALGVRPMLGLPQTPADDDSFAFLRVLTGLGVVEIPPRERMFNLELAQRWVVNPRLQAIVPDPDATRPLEPARLKALMEAIIEDPGASRALRKHVATRYPAVTGRSAPRTDDSRDVVPEILPVCDAQPELRNPAHRRLRVYAVDPSLSTRLATAAVNEVTLKVRWEALVGPGLAGEYLAIDDVDAAGRTYEAVNLNDPRLLAQDGWAPAEGNPQFHQQMVYAVAMKTIEHFERALGRPVLWRPRPDARKPFDDRHFVGRLTIRPHALRQANAFYSPEQVSLQFGYLEASADDPGDHMPGSRVYTCLSHDIIAHETTHAILDGMHRRFNEPSNPDVLALHEAFADIVALLQHFTITEVLQSEIARTRGDLEAESNLGRLAVQLGHATGRRGALRDAIGTLVNGAWTRIKPDPSELQRRLTPHARGAVLVAAVFDAFLAIYKTRTADLLRLATGGTGVLPGGAIHPDLVRRLADEAAKSAGHVLTMCIRALDYLPPVDPTFFEYLRALITADFDLVRDDRLGYRVAFVEAFRQRGIYPVEIGGAARDTVRTLSVDTLRWQGLDMSRFPRRVQAQVLEVVAGLQRYANACLYVDDRATLFEETRARRVTLLHQLRRVFKASRAFAVELGIDPTRSFEVHGLRPAMRIGPDGRHTPQVIVALTQSTTVAPDRGTGTPRHTFRGGSTLIVDLSVPELTYRIVKNIGSVQRRARTAAFVRDALADPLRALFFAPDRKEPFAALHALADEGT
jgi:subtilisin family serine protease